MRYFKSSFALILVILSVARAANCQSDSPSPSIPPNAEALENLAAAEDMADVAASMAALQAEDGPQANVPSTPSRYYLVSEPMENSFRLFRLNFLRRLPWIRNQSWAEEVPDIERYVWYTTAPAIFLLKGIPLYMATNNLTVSIIGPLLLFFPKYFAMLLVKTSMRLRAHAWAVEQWHLDSIDDGVPGLKRILRLTGQTMATRARVVDSLSSKNFFIMEVDANAPPFPPDFTIEVPQNGQRVKANLIEIPSMQNTKFVFSLRGVSDEGQLPTWTLSFEELENGLKLPEDLRKIWWTHAEHHFSTATINMKMVMGEEEKDIGPLASLQGVADLLGHTMLNKELFGFFFGIHMAIYARHIKLLQEYLSRPDYMALSIYSREELEGQLKDVIRRRDRIKSWSSALASLLKKKVKLKTSEPTPPREVNACDFMLMH